jgi:hypothetical protein
MPPSRLFDTTTLELVRTNHACRFQPYASLSHAWDEYEITFDQNQGSVWELQKSKTIRVLVPKQNVMVGNTRGSILRVTTSQGGQSYPRPSTPCMTGAPRLRPAIFTYPMLVPEASLCQIVVGSPGPGLCKNWSLPKSSKYSTNRGNYLVRRQPFRRSSPASPASMEVFLKAPHHYMNAVSRPECYGQHIVKQSGLKRYRLLTPRALRSQHASSVWRG